MAVTIQNNKPGWSREVTTYEDGSKYICDGRINSKGEYEYHEYNISADNKRHTHVHGTENGYIGGHPEQTKPWWER